MKDNVKGICLGVHITNDMHAKLVKAAKEKEVTMSVIVRMAIKDYLAKAAIA